MPFSFGFPALGGAESSESEPRSGGQEPWPLVQSSG